MTEPKKEIAGFTAEAKKEIPLAANASGIVSAARTALENVRSLFSETFTINVRASTNTDDGDGKKDSRNDSRNRDSTGSTFLRMSSGGRFSRPTSVQVAEDGDAEYIIPVKKENRALPLLRQLLGELSPAARASLTGGSAIPTGSHVIPGFGTPGERASGSFLVENGRQPRAGEARVEGSPVYNSRSDWPNHLQHGGTLPAANTEIPLLTFVSSRGLERPENEPVCSFSVENGRQPSARRGRGLSPFLSESE